MYVYAMYIFYSVWVGYCAHRMAVVSSLTVGDLQAFLQTKWGVGVKAVPDREGEPHSSGGQFLKLYRSTQSLTGTQRHTHHATQSMMQHHHLLLVLLKFVAVYMKNTTQHH